VKQNELVFSVSSAGFGKLALQTALDQPVAPVEAWFVPELSLNTYRASPVGVPASAVPVWTQRPRNVQQSPAVASHAPSFRPPEQDGSEAETYAQTLSAFAVLALVCVHVAAHAFVGLGSVEAAAAP
jgi:hypothetical protein